MYCQEVIRKIVLDLSPLSKQKNPTTNKKNYKQTNKNMIRYLIMTYCFCFVFRHINLVGHLMPNQVKENKSKKKFKGEVLGISDKL